MHGGVERVTSIIASFLRKNDISSYYLSLTNNEEYRDEFQYVLPDPQNYCSESNILFVKELIHERSIKIIINQGGLSPYTSKFSYILKSLDVKIISVVHSSLLGAIYSFPYTYAKTINSLKLSWLLPILKTQFIKGVVLKLYKHKYRHHYFELCTKSDIVVLLSKEYVKELNFFIQPHVANNIVNIGNPCSFHINKYQTKKNNTILYVGRIDIYQKQVDLLLYIWDRICRIRPNWKLQIIGDGPDMGYLKKIYSELSLINVEFLGFCEPQNYYINSSILCMTSAFEGFPMVLPEAMYYGCVPIVFESFSSIKEIIDHGKNGLLVSPFDIEEYVNKLLLIMDNKELRDNMAAEALRKSKEFSISNIGSKWQDLITYVSQL